MWIKVKDKLPTIGQYVILFANGVVQNEIFYLDACDISDYAPPEYFWANDCNMIYPRLSDDQAWMPLPEEPND